MKEKKKIISHYNHYSAVMFSIFRDMLLIQTSSHGPIKFKLKFYLDGQMV